MIHFVPPILAIVLSLLVLSALIATAPASRSYPTLASYTDLHYAAVWQVGYGRR